ncbi:MAG: hypothetical protein ABIA92_05170 [Patescibacteria group bacterium]
MKRLCQPPDGQDPEVYDFGDKSFAECVLIAESKLADAQLSPDDPELWHTLRLKIQDTAVKYVDCLPYGLVDPKDVRASRAVLRQAVDSLPADADPKLRHWLENVPQTMLLCDDVETLKASLMREIERVLE